MNRSTGSAADGSEADPDESTSGIGAVADLLEGARYAWGEETR